MENRKWVLSSLAVGAAGLGVWTRRQKVYKYVKEKATELKANFNNEKKSFPIQKAGVPDPYDVEENKMVAEGSTFGVNYYNDKQQGK